MRQMARFKIELPRGIDTEAMGEVIGEELDRAVSKIQDKFEHTTDFWQHEVDFESTVTQSGPKTWEIEVGTDERIYGFVSGGTSIRYATMTKDFEPKTMPGSLISDPGYGGVAIVSKKIPHEGIKARDFPGQIYDAMHEDIERDLVRAVRDAARASGHGVAPSISRAAGSVSDFVSGLFKKLRRHR